MLNNYQYILTIAIISPILMNFYLHLKILLLTLLLNYDCKIIKKFQLRVIGQLKINNIAYSIIPDVINRQTIENIMKNKFIDSLIIPIPGL